MDRSAFVAGLRDVAPAVPSSIPLGMLFGATAVQVGIDPLAATAFSVFTFAAIAQLTAVQLLQTETTLPVVLVTMLLINLRYVIYSASLAPKVAHLPRRWRVAIAYPLFDINYALAEARFTGTDEGHRGWYFAGISIPTVVSLVTATLLGALVGEVVGRDLQLDFIVPLVFVAVLASQIEDRSGMLAAISAGAVAVVAVGLPFNLGLIVAAVCGTAVGILIDRDRKGKES